MVYMTPLCAGGVWGKGWWGLSNPTDEPLPPPKAGAKLPVDIFTIIEDG